MAASSEVTQGYHLSFQQAAVLQECAVASRPVLVALLHVTARYADLPRLRAALLQLMQRHEILRTRYVRVAGLRLPLQQVGTPAYAWVLTAAATDDDELLLAAQYAMASDDHLAVSVTIAPSLEAGCKLAVALPLHSVDCQSIQDLIEQWLELYRRDTAAATVEESIQYVDYAAWQRDLIDSPLGREGKTFWKNQLQAAGPALRLPFMRRAHGNGTASSEVACPAATACAVEQLATTFGSSPEMVVLAAWAAFLSRLARHEDLTIGWHCQARSAELARSLGRFVFKLPLNLRVQRDASLQQLLLQVQAATDMCRSWQDYFTADEVTADPLQAQFEHVRIAAAEGHCVQRIDTELIRASLRLELIEQGAHYRWRWCFSSAYDRESVALWAEQFSNFLHHAVRSPTVPVCRLAWYQEPQHGRLAHELDGRTAAHAAPAVLLHQLFEQQARRTPAAVALWDETQALNYNELNERADQLAGVLRGLAPTADRLVGVFLERSTLAIVAILGILKAGAAYLPLDPAYPPARLVAMMEDAQMLALVTDASHQPLLLQQPAVAAIPRILIDACAVPAANLAHPGCVAQPSTLAYAIYTSGSTGRPKAVMITHANAVASTCARFTFYREPVQNFLLLSSLSFDSSVAGLFWALSQGGAVHIPNREQQRDPAALAALIAQHGISHLLTFPGFYAQILEHLKAQQLRCVIVAGESCDASVVTAHVQRLPEVSLCNEYGPTEGTVWASAHPIVTQRWHGDEPPMSVSIGTAVPSACIHILDEFLEPCPIGVAGDLYVGGAGVARGYWQRAGLSAERFVADPFREAARLYRTGDQARYWPNGDIEYLGRIDAQVKIRGHRIESGEIEALLLRHPQVRQASVIAIPDAGGALQLTAFVVSRDRQAHAAAADLQQQLRVHLAAMLTPQMLPTRIAVLASLPQTPNGKVDRKALAALQVEISNRPAYLAPRNEIEQQLAQIWQSALKMSDIGVHDNFFSLGGHSLLVTQVIARIRQQLHVDLPMRDFFESTSLEALAAELEARGQQVHSESARMADIVATVEMTMEVLE